MGILEAPETREAVRDVAAYAADATAARFAHTLTRETNGQLVCC